MFEKPRNVLYNSEVYIFNRASLLCITYFSVGIFEKFNIIVVNYTTSINLSNVSIIHVLGRSYLT